MLEQAEASLAAELNQAALPGNLAGLKRLSVLVPIYNERWTVVDVLRKVAAVALPIELEIVAIDDGSVDGSADVVAALCEEIPNLRLVRQPRNGGKGSAIRRGIEEMTGDVAVIQDADLEYDPADLPRLLAPLLAGQADAVFGSRFAGSSRQCLPFWHSQINRLLTTASNMLTGVSLTDMETGYKVIRGDILRELRLKSRSYTLEPEITCRLAQWGARIHEVPVSYQGRTFEEGKKIRGKDGVKALLTLARCRFFDANYSLVPEDTMLRSARHARRYHGWLATQLQPFLGSRVLDAGAGVGTLSAHFLKRARLVLADVDGHRVDRLRARFGGRSNVRIEQAELEDRQFAEDLRAENLDTVVCVNSLQQVGADFLALRNFYDLLPAGGQAVIVVPAEMRLFNRVDQAMGNQRRYQPHQLEQLMMRAGFEVIERKSFNRLGSLGWFGNGSLLGRRRFGSLQVAAFDRLWSVGKYFDRWLPVPAASLLVVGRKP